MAQKALPGSVKKLLSLFAPSNEHCIDAVHEDGWGFRLLFAPSPQRKEQKSCQVCDKILYRMFLLGLNGMILYGAYHKDVP